MVDLTLYQSRLSAYMTGTKNYEVDAMQSQIAYEFKSHPSYFQITYLTNNRDVHIVDKDNSFSKKVGQKKMLGYPNDTYAIGEYLTLNGNTWLIMGKDDDSVVQERCYISKCNSNLLINDNGVYKVYPCVIADVTSSLGVDYASPFDNSNGTIKLTVKNDSVTQTIVEGQRFIFGNKRPYKITNINDFLTDTIYITLQRDAMNYSTDQLVRIGTTEYWIADYTGNPVPEPTGSELIITPTDTSVKKTNTSGTTYTVNKYTSGVLVSGVSFTFTIDPSTTALVGDYTFATVGINGFNIKSNTVNKKVVVKCTEVGGTGLIIYKTVNLLLY